MGYPFLKNYSDGSRNLKKQNGFIKSVRAIRKEFEISDNMLEISGPSDHLEMSSTQINLNFRITLYKCDISKDLLRCCVLEKIRRYPISEWL